MSWRDQLFSSSAIDENEERLSDGEIDPEQVDLVDESVDVAEKILQVTQYLRGVEDYDAVTYRELRTSVGVDLWRDEELLIRLETKNKEELPSRLDQHLFVDSS